MASDNSEKTGGVLEIRERSGGFLRDPERSFQPGPADVWVPPDLIRSDGLVEGAYVTGDARPGDRGWVLATVESICGLTPRLFRDRDRFEKLQAVNPSERIRLGDGGNLSMRIVDLIAPIGKGTRGLIVAPPKSGKTRLLEEMAAGIRAFE